MSMRRRTFLQTLGAGSLVGLNACGGGSSAGASSGGSGTPPPAPPAPPAPPSPILVVIQIQGGHDWLSTLVPTTGANATAYTANRPTLKIPDTNLTDLGSGLGLNKDLLGLDVLHAAGKVAWIPGIGMNNPNLSHFTATDFWSQGAANPDGTGWLGRWGDAVFSTADLLRGIATTSDILLMNHGHKRDFVAITSASGYQFPTFLRSGGAVSDSNLLKTGYNASLVGSATDPMASLAASEGKLWYDAQTAFGVLPPRTPSVAYPGDAAYAVTGLSNQLSNQLKLVAQMIANGIPGQVYTVRLGGFDTHSNQATDYPRLMGSLGGAIKAFYDDLATMTTTVNGTAVKAQDRVLMMAWSEFGRRIKENNGGTDHGTAGLSFLVGNGLKGGFFGQGYPDLNTPDSNGNMLYTTEFRSLYATLLDKWLGGDSKTILGATYPALGFL